MTVSKQAIFKPCVFSQIRIGVKGTATSASQGMYLKIVGNHIGSSILSTPPHIISLSRFSFLFLPRSHSLPSLRRANEQADLPPARAREKECQNLALIAGHQMLNCLNLLLRLLFLDGIPAAAAANNRSRRTHPCHAKRFKSAVSNKNNHGVIAAKYDKNNLTTKTAGTQQHSPLRNIGNGKCNLQHYSTNKTKRHNVHNWPGRSHTSRKTRLD